LLHGKAVEIHDDRGNVQIGRFPNGGNTKCPNIGSRPTFHPLVSRQPCPLSLSIKMS
jgi:hypothetical protein